MKRICSNCGKVLQNSGFVIGLNNQHLCFSCGSKLYPAAFESTSIYIFEDGIPAIILPRGILIPQSEGTYLTSTVSDMLLVDYYQQIAEKTRFSIGSVEKLVVEKIDEFSGLVSEETALQLLAQDLGFELNNNSH